VWLQSLADKGQEAKLDKGVKWTNEHSQTFKELRNKLAWSLGTATGQRYSSVHGAEVASLRKLAGQLAGVALGVMAQDTELKLTFDRSKSNYPVRAEAE